MALQVVQEGKVWSDRNLLGIYQELRSALIMNMYTVNDKTVNDKTMMIEIVEMLLENFNPYSKSIINNGEPIGPDFRPSTMVNGHLLHPNCFNIAQDCIHSLLYVRF